MPASKKKAPAIKKPAKKKTAKPARAKSDLLMRTAGSASQDSVANSWARLEAWLADHLPTLLDALNPPASAKEIAAFEKAIGQKLPESVRESYRIHNGHNQDMEGLLFGLPLLPLKTALETWKVMTDIFKSPRRQKNAAEEVCCFPEQTIQPLYFDRGWIPLSDDSGGNNIAIDLNPAASGTAGQVIIFGRDEFCRPVLARDWGQFLADVATELERGNFIISEEEFDDELEFVLCLARPKQKHFHSAGVNWSRAKLGLESLSSVDTKVWKQYAKKSKSP